MRYAIIILLLFSGIFIVADTYGQKTSFTAVIDKDGVQRVEVTGGEYYYKPDHIIVKVNVPVELKFKKEAGIVPHNILMHEPDAGIDFNEAMEKEPKVIKFTPKKVGKYPFSCDKKFLFFKNHRDKGMKGILEVVE